EDDTWRILFRVFKQVADTGCPDPNEHFNEIRTGNREERYAGFTRNSTRQKRLTCTRRPDQKDSFWNTCSKFSKLTRVFQEIHNFFKLRFLFIRTRNVCESDFFAIIGME